VTIFFNALEFFSGNYFILKRYASNKKSDFPYFRSPEGNVKVNKSKFQS